MEESKQSIYNSVKERKNEYYETQRWKEKRKETPFERRIRDCEREEKKHSVI